LFTFDKQEGRIVGLIIKINIVVFFLWYLLYLYDPFFMETHFLVSWNGVKSGHLWTLVTSVFSHNLFFHLFINMYLFYGFGKVLEEVLGSVRFLKIYLGSGFVGSLGHCFVSAFILHRPDLQALGASGAISGVLVFFALMFPKEKVYLLGLIPLPAFWAIVMYVALDFWGLMSQVQGSGMPIGYGAHLGGALAGATSFFYYRSQLRFDSG
jgi:membrane associated rhomboid family serine protease